MPGPFSYQTPVAPWLPEYSRPGYVEWRDDHRFTLHNIRNFRYPAPGASCPAWYIRQLDLSQLVATDLVLSYWGATTLPTPF